MQAPSANQEAEFISLISHAFRSSLGKVKWYIEEIKEAKEIQHISPEICEALDAIDENNEHLLSLVNTVSAISHIDHGTILLLPQVTDVVRMIEDLIKRRSLYADRNEIHILFTKPESFPHILIDKFKLQELIDHLIENAIFYNKPKGTVTITLAGSDKKITLSIADTGIGIAASDQPKLFTKFFRTEQAARLNPEGSGLGLYVVKGYVTLLDGTIHVESTSDKGTHVTVTLPISQREESHEERRGDNEKDTHY